MKLRVAHLNGRSVTKAWIQLEKFHSSLEKNKEIRHEEKKISPVHNEPYI